MMNVKTESTTIITLSENERLQLGYMLDSHLTTTEDPFADELLKAIRK